MIRTRLCRLGNFRTLFAVPAILFASACGSPKAASIADLGGRENLSLFALGSLRGARDGDRLQAEAMFSDSSSILTLEMRFAIGSPTRLETGTWRWSRNHGVSNGTLAERSVMFLGGQSGPPSIGGVFDLLDSAGVARYRATLPVMELGPLPRSGATPKASAPLPRTTPAAVR